MLAAGAIVVGVVVGGGIVVAVVGAALVVLFLIHTAAVVMKINFRTFLFAQITFDEARLLVHFISTHTSGIVPIGQFIIWSSSMKPFGKNFYHLNNSKTVL